MRQTNLRLSCPHCGTFSRIRNSIQLTPLYREAMLECQNMECGWRGWISLEITRTLQPSMMPRNGIQLPLAQHIRDAIQQQCPANAGDH